MDASSYRFVDEHGPRRAITLSDDMMSLFCTLLVLTDEFMSIHTFIIHYKMAVRHTPTRPTVSLSSKNCDCVSQ